MTIETTLESRETKEVILKTKDGEHINLPSHLVSSDFKIGEKVWLSLESTPPAEASPKDILNELLGADQYEEAV